MQKTCRICAETKPIDEFYWHPTYRDNHFNECKVCISRRNRENRDLDPEKYRQRVRKWRKNNSEREALSKLKNLLDSPLKEAARRAVMYALQAGVLVKPSICDRCSTETTNLQAHHPVYSEATLLDVEWLCRVCHGKATSIHS